MNLKDNTELQGGKYRIIRVLGQGGFGITYLAENVYFNRIVAIKEFFPKSFCGRDNTSHLTLGTANNAETVEKLRNRFMKEAQNIARLNHPGIVKIHDIFKENNTAYYVMDYIEGENLNEIVKREGAMSEERAVGYIKKVGEALAYIHSKNMTHFDVKPANIMIRKEDDAPILIDFGLSKQYDASGDATSTILNGVSQGYSPIELYNVGSLASFSPQTDVYSLGATLLFLLTGKVPPSASDIAIEGLSVPNSISSELSSAIKSALQLKRSSRPEKIEDFIDDLRFAEIIDKSSQQNATVFPNNEETQFVGQQDQQRTSSSSNYNREKEIIINQIKTLEQEKINRQHDNRIQSILGTVFIILGCIGILIYLLYHNGDTEPGFAILIIFSFLFIMVGFICFFSIFDISKIDRNIIDLESRLT